MTETGTCIYLKPPHPNADEMAKRMKRFEKEFRGSEPAKLISAEGRKTCLDARENLSSGKTSGKRRWRAFFQDFNRFIDFYLSRYIVWRELRHERRNAAADGRRAL